MVLINIWVGDEDFLVNPCTALTVPSHFMCNKIVSRVKMHESQLTCVTFKPSNFVGEHGKCVEHKTNL